MRIQVASLLCALSCCALTFFEGEHEMPATPDLPRIQQAAPSPPSRTILAAPTAPARRDATATESPIASWMTIPKVQITHPDPPELPSGRQRGWLQVEVMPHAVHFPGDKFGLSIRRGSRLKNHLDLKFHKPSFEVELPVGEYTVIVSDIGYPWHWKRGESYPAGQPDSPNLFLHQETVLVSANQNTIVFVDPFPGGRFWLYAMSVPFDDENRIRDLLLERAAISSREPSGCCFLAGPPEYAKASLREISSDKQVPLTWSYTDRVNVTGKVELGAGLLMQDVLTAGEYELTLTYEDKRQTITLFQIENGKTTRVVLPGLPR